MQVRFGSRKRIQFTDKKHPMLGIISTMIAIAAWILMGVLFYLSSTEKGTSGIIIGFVGILVLIASAIGFLIAIRCYKKEDIYMTTPMTGAILNGFLVVLCLLLYVLGTVSY